MANRPRRFWTLIIILLLTIYVVIVLRGLTENARRSLLLQDETDKADRVFISIVVTNANPSTRELTAQLGFRLAGNVAKDDVTPAVDLKLLINNVRGQQEFDFPKEKRMNRTEAVFPLNGDVNKYPFDSYETPMRFLMTTPARNVQPQASKEPESIPELPHQADEFVVSSSELLRNTPVALSVSISASIPGLRFKGNVSRGNIKEPTGIALHLARANNVIAVSLIVMLMMTVLSMSLLAMVIRRLRQEKRRTYCLSRFRFH